MPSKINGGERISHSTNTLAQSWVRFKALMIHTADSNPGNVFSIAMEMKA